MPSTRRRLLKATPAVALGFAGCSSLQRRVERLGRPRPARRVDPGWRPGSGTWASRYYGPANRAHNPHATPPRTEPSVHWESEFEASLEDGGVVVADGTVYVTTERNLVAIGVEDGQRRWERQIFGPAGLSYVDGRLYQLNWDLQESEVVARALDGAEQWRTTIPDSLRGGLHEQDGYVFVAGRDRYWTLHADTGDVVQSSDDWVRNLAAVDDSLYAAFSGILVEYEIDRAQLDERWRAQYREPAESRRPVVGDAVYVPQWTPGDAGGALWVVGASGEDRATVELDHDPGDLTLTPRGPVVQSGEDLLALRADGARRWTTAVDRQTRVVAADGAVYAGDPLVAVDDETGNRLWTREIDANHRLAAVGSTLYAATYGRLVAFRSYSN